jgi:hypothetical protein
VKEIILWWCVGKGGHQKMGGVSTSTCVVCTALALPVHSADSNETTFSCVPKVQGPGTFVGHVVVEWITTGVGVGVGTGITAHTRVQAGPYAASCSVFVSGTERSTSQNIVLPFWVPLETTTPLLIRCTVSDARNPPTPLIASVTICAHGHALGAVTLGQLQTIIGTPLQTTSAEFWAPVATVGVLALYAAIVGTIVLTKTTRRS